MDDLQIALNLAMKVLGDWRVIFVALAFIIACAALRAVGIVYKKAPKTKNRAPSAPAVAVKKPSPRISQESPEE